MVCLIIYSDGFIRKAIKIQSRSRATKTKRRVCQRTQSKSGRPTKLKIQLESTSPGAGALQPTRTYYIITIYDEIVHFLLLMLFRLAATLSSHFYLDIIQVRLSSLPYPFLPKTVNSLCFIISLIKLSFLSNFNF